MKLIDMGDHHGQRTFYTGGRSLAELMQDGEVVAIPDPDEGIIYKRPANCTSVELAAKLSVEEARQITAEWNRGVS